MYSILYIIGMIPVGLIGLTLMSSGQTVRELIDRFFMLFLAIPEMIRNGCSYVIGKSMEFIKKGAVSVGLSGEHVIQRIIGSILLTAIFILSTVVAFLTLTITFMGIFGGSDNSFIESLPVSVEVLMGIELIAGGIMFGMLLLDVVGTTHITKFFSAERLTKVQKYVYGVIFASGLVVSAIILGLGGVMRADALMSNPIVTESIAEDSHLLADNVQTSSIPEGYQGATKILMTSIPVLSFFAGTAGFVGALPFLAMLIKTIVFIAVVIGLGVFWMIGYACHVIVNLLYNFIYQLGNIFITFGETIKGWLTKKGAASNTIQQNVNNYPPPDPVHSGTTTSCSSGTAVTSHNANKIVSPIYDSGDKNWNPLG